MLHHEKQQLPLLHCTPKYGQCIKTTFYCRMITRRCFLLSGVKGMQHYGAQIIESVLKLREEGKAHREIAY